MNIGVEYKNDTEKQLTNAIIIAIGNNYVGFPFNALLNYYLDTDKEKRQHIKELIAAAMKRGMIRRFMLSEKYYGIATSIIEAEYMDEFFDRDYGRAKSKAMDIFRQYSWDFTDRLKEAKQDIIEVYKEENAMFSRLQSGVLIDTRHETECFKELEALKDIFELYYEEKIESYYETWKRGIEKAKEEALYKIEL